MDQLSTDLASLKIDRDPPVASGGHLRGWSLGLAGIAALLAAAAWAYPRVEAELFKTPVHLGTVLDISPTLSATSLTATGYVVAQRRSKVGSMIPGRVVKVHVREGARVERGDMLAELDATDLRSSVHAAHARVLSAQARILQNGAVLRESEVQLQRQRVLLAQRAVARSVVEDLEARVNTLRAEVQSAEADELTTQAEERLARANLARMNVLAPITGTVLNKPLDVGETVDLLTPILELADLHSLLVEVDVPESRFSTIELGGPCEVTFDALPGRRLKGRTRELGKRVNRSKATIPVKVAFDTEDAVILPDMSARVSFLSRDVDARDLAGPTTRVVPQRAVTQRDGQRVLFVSEGGKVKMVPITLGRSSTDGFELLEGPEVGTRVVLEPPEILRDGHTIKESSD
ncbi:MAG: efflux RND transporter periplasmic adaptor subunit [Myxococcales bacterium]